MRQRTTCAKCGEAIPVERIRFADAHGKRILYCGKRCSNAAAAASHYATHRDRIARRRAKRRREIAVGK